VCQALRCVFDVARTEENIYETMQDMSERAAKYGRKIDFGLRIHVIVRETEQEARQYTKTLMSKFDVQMGEILKNRTQDSNH
jgi:alkanesulfonate monooxygenase